MNYTTSQQEAIAHESGPCLVLAVPGAGKTTVLIERLARLLRKGIRPGQIASITFSKQQALDMRRRFCEQQKDHPALLAMADQLTFSTIHAFCYRILRQVYAQKQWPLQLIEGSASYNKYRLVTQFFREANGRSLTEEELETFFRIDGYLKNTLTDYKQYVRRFAERFPSFETIARRYEDFKRTHGLIDFDDMLLQTLEILDREPSVLAALRERFLYYQVDEAQDTSPVQLRIIQKLAAPTNHLFLVADDDQAIYGFRGADPSYLLQFKEQYPQAKILMMQENHRSVRNIVQLSSHFIQGNQARFQKHPSTADTQTQQIEILFAKRLQDQLRRICKDLPEDLARGSCAILFRNNVSALPMADALLRAKIPFASRANPVSFFRDGVVQDVLDLFQVACNPSDLSAFSRIYYKLNAYLKKDFLHQMEEMDAYESVFSRLRRCEGAQNAFYRETIDTLAYHFECLPADRPDRAIDRLELSIGYGDYLREKARRENTTVHAFQRSLEILKTVGESLPDITALALRLQELKEALTSARQRTDGVVLSTIHGAKGLEYDSVWIIDLLQGEFPSTTALEFEQAGDATRLEEERRLFYVGMTRAKQRLHLVGRKAVNEEPCEASQFLSELTKKKR